MGPGNRVIIRDDIYLSILTERSGRISTKLIRMVVSGDGNGTEGD